MLNLKPSIWTAFFSGYDAKTAIEEIAAADFYACDFSNSHSKELIDQAERSGNSLRYFKEGLEFQKFAEENLNPAMGFPAETPKHFIENTGNKLKALHINGNFGKSDDHLFPFNVKMANSPDWLEIMKALAESPYDGTFNFEVPGESFCPLPVKRKKLEYARWLVDYMQSPEFFSLPEYAGIHN